MSVPHIVLENVHKSFGSNHVLRGVDIGVGKGRSLVVIGGSGSGKSVTLKCILGLLHPETGSIRVDGQEIIGLQGAALDEMMGRFGMLFQGAALFDSLSVWRNVAFGLIYDCANATDPIVFCPSVSTENPPCIRHLIPGP